MSTIVIRIRNDNIPSALNKVWQDKIGRVWVGYENLDDVAKTYDLHDQQTVDKIDNFMTKLVSRAVDVYTQ